MRTSPLLKCPCPCASNRLPNGRYTRQHTRICAWLIPVIHNTARGQVAKAKCQERDLRKPRCIGHLTLRKTLQQHCKQQTTLLTARLQTEDACWEQNHQQTQPTNDDFLCAFATRQEALMQEKSSTMCKQSSSSKQQTCTRLFRSCTSQVTTSTLVEQPSKPVSAQPMFQGVWCA